ncbi:hypothetical protein FHW16_004738 [Phyllobacterium myrsinacearum]|uniref:Uncharacterized protein n=1 Tax=Phyllobacterium myrsinacearum TaxID=28101 RepID=A0A839EKN9_9HYPH|nr:hypothetical protein [Phyllobacterium myrsinacearum]
MPSPLFWSSSTRIWSIDTIHHTQSFSPTTQIKRTTNPLYEAQKGRTPVRRCERQLCYESGHLRWRFTSITAPERNNQGLPIPAEDLNEKGIFPLDHRLDPAA